MSRLQWATGFLLLSRSACLFAADEAAATLSLGLGEVFTFFFLTLGPASVIGPFARETAGLVDTARRRVAFVTTGIALASILVATTIGTLVLRKWGISSGALLITAGIVLFLVALNTIRRQYGHAKDDTPSSSTQASIARVAFQMAFPYVVSPYGIAIVILVLTTRPDSVPLTPIVAMLVGIMLLNAMVMLVAHRITRSMYLNPTLAVVSSVLAVLQAALGVQMVLAGLRMAGVS
jgi:multiple antibiotic resistance protein